MKISREQVDTIFDNLKTLCLCKGCLFETFIDAYHQKVTELIDKQARKIERLEAENKSLQTHRMIRATDLADLQLREDVKTFVEKMALNHIEIEIPKRWEDDMPIFYEQESEETE
jgi:hypothetical protein